MIAQNKTEIVLWLSVITKSKITKSHFQSEAQHCVVKREQLIILQCFSVSEQLGLQEMLFHANSISASTQSLKKLLSTKEKL